MSLQIIYRVHSQTCEMSQKNNLSLKRASSHHINTCLLRSDVKVQDALVLSSVSHKALRQVQENASLTAKSTKKSCTFLRDLPETWCVSWYDSTGVVLGILRKYKRILYFCKISCTAMCGPF